VENESIDDFVVLRSDGTAIYNLAVVSDDIEQRVSHIIRGDDHISNTPKQILLYRALGQSLPVFAHVPMILGSDGKRLSKRHGATAIGEYQNQGILPEAMRNFLALLGWSPGDDREILTLDELIQLFSLDGINRKSAVFDHAKLEWMNGQYINASSAVRLEPLVTAAVVAAGIASATALQARSNSYYAVIDLVKQRARTVQEIAEQARPFLVDRIDYAPDAVQKYWKDPAEVAANLDALRHRFVKLTEWTPAALEAELRKSAESLSVAAGRLIHPLRVALVGTTVSPGIFDVLAVMGHDLSLRRIDAAIDRLRRGNLQANSA
jgi:glutamyl-tRNA synthetase